MFPQDQLLQRLKKALPDAEIKITDLTGGADHYSVEVVSEAFRGKNKLARHRLVYAPLEDVLGGPLHALQLTTKFPGE